MVLGHGAFTSPSSTHSREILTLSTKLEKYAVDKGVRHHMTVLNGALGASDICL